MSTATKDLMHAKLRAYYSNSLSLEDNLGRYMGEQSIKTEDALYNLYRAGGSRLAFADLAQSYWTNFATFTPLTIPWLDAYSAEGPLFVATSPANNAPITSMPSEGTRGTAATAATGGNAPLYIASALNGRPALRFDGTDDSLQTLGWTAIASPFSIACIFKVRSYTQGVGAVVYDGRETTNRAALLALTTATPDSWWIYQGGGSINGGTFDTNLHFSYAEYNAGGNDTLNIDGATVVFGDAGSNTLTGVTLGAAFNGGTAAAIDIAFWGVINRSLTPQEQADLLAYTTSHYA